MHYNFIPMNKDYANEIAYNCKYDGIYSFYDMTEDEENYIASNIHIVFSN